MFNPMEYVKDCFRGCRLLKVKSDEYSLLSEDEDEMLRLISPDRFVEYDTHVLIDEETYVRCIIGGITYEDLGGIPDGITSRASERIMALAHEGARVELCTGFIKIPRVETSQALKDAYINNSIDQATAKKYTEGSINDLQLENEASDIRAVYNEIYYNSQNVYNAQFIITIMGSQQEVKVAEDKIKGILQSEIIEYIIPFNLMMPAFIASRPFPVSDKRFWIRVSSETAAVLCTATSLNSRIDEEGLYFGNDRKTKAECLININYKNDFPSQHMIVFGPTGSGKSFTVSMLIMRIKDFYDKRVCVITPKNELKNFKAIAKYYGDDAETIDIGEFGEPFNPLQIMFDEKSMGNSPAEYSSAYFRHIRVLKNFFATWFEGEFSPNTKGYVEDIIHAAYKSKGILRSKPETWKNDFPLLEDLCAVAEKDMDNESLNSETRKSAGAFFRKIRAIGPGGSLSYLNRRREKPIDFSKGLIVFDISGVDEEIRPAMNVLVTGMLGSRFRTELEKETIIVVDEARVFLRNEHLATFLLDTVAMGRSYGIALWLITQNPGDLAKNGVEEEFRTNMPLSIVMGATLDPAKVGPIQRYFNLSKTAVEDLLTCDQGDGLLLMRGEEIPLRFEPTQQERDIIENEYNPEEPKKVTAYENSGYSILPEYQGLKDHHGVILKEWISGDANKLRKEGWEPRKLPSKAAGGRGSDVMWVPKGSIDGDIIKVADINGKKIGNMSVWHLATAVQLESFVVHEGIKCSSDHNNGADLLIQVEDNIYAGEVEKAGNRTPKQLLAKVERLMKYTDYRFICTPDDYPYLSGIIGADKTITTGKPFREWIATLTEGTTTDIDLGEVLEENDGIEDQPISINPLVVGGQIAEEAV